MAAAVSQRSAYSGQTRKCMREGSGSYEYDNKYFKYDGQWKNGKKHGHGKLTFQDGSYYEGMFNMGEIEGFGFRYFATSGCKYQGQFYKGELHGKGRMIWPDGSIYEGQWINNRRQGVGIMKSVKENLIYKGSFFQNKRQGHGTMIYPSGDRYDGEWLEDKRHGEGDMHYVDGTVYEGQFGNDVFNGSGIMRHCSGVIYNGQWKDGDPVAMPTKLVIVHDGKEPLEVTQGEPFSIMIQCQNDNGDVIEEDNCREIRLTAGFKHIKAKKGTALFDLIEDYEEKPLETPYYEVLNYPLTDFVVEEEDQSAPLDEDEDPLKDEDKEGGQDQEDFKDDERDVGDNGRDDEEEKKDGEEGQDKDSAPPGSPGQTSVEQSAGYTESTLESSAVTSSTDFKLAMEKQSEPLPPPVSNHRTERGRVEWNNIHLATAPPRYPPFVALDEEEKKVKARQQRQDSVVEGKKRSVVGYIEAKRMARKKHDEHYARLGEYVLIAQDVSEPPFMGRRLQPGFLILKLKRPKQVKKPKEVKPKWDTQKHIAAAMVRT